MIKPTLVKQIALLSFPIILSNLLQVSISAIDTYMVGQLGAVSIAAIGLGNTIRLLLGVTVLSVSAGAISLAAQAKGSRDPQRLSFVTRQSLLSGLFLSILISIAGSLAAEPLIYFMNNGERGEVADLGIAYLRLIFLGSPVLILNIVINRLMQGAGDTLSPLLITIGMAILNVVFNYIFIFGWGSIPAYGVEGAALGTIAARFVMVVFSMWLFYSGRNVIHILKGSWRPHWQMMKDILSIGIPSGIQGFFRHGANLFIIRMVTATELGTFGAAVIAIGFQVESIVIQPALGINIAASSMVGRELGKWQTQEAYFKGNIMTVLGILTMIFCCLPIWFFPAEIIKVFDPSQNPEILAATTSYFLIAISVQPLYAVALVIVGALRGSGHTKPAMISSILGRNLITILFGWYFAFYLDLGYVGVWYGMVVGKLFSMVYVWSAWRSRKWVQVALEKTDIYRSHLHKLSPTLLKRFLAEHRAPHMAVSGTQEIVESDRVIYRQPNGDSTIHFHENSYAPQ